MQSSLHQAAYVLQGTPNPAPALGNVTGPRIIPFSLSRGAQGEANQNLEGFVTQLQPKELEERLTETWLPSF